MTQGPKHSWQPAGIITLTTDFGSAGPYVGVMHGAILLRMPAAKIVDITHDIFAHWPYEAGFWISRSARYFPAGTVHVCVVDPGVGTDRGIVLVQSGEQVFLAPDNGLLAPVIEQNRGAQIYHLRSQRLRQFAFGQSSATFHGRDVFAPVAAELAAGRADPHDLGERSSKYVPALFDEPELHDGAVTGVVVSVDKFGNLITNIDGQWLEHFRAPMLSAGGHDFRIARTYGDVAPGEMVALLSSFGSLELACAEASAADRLGLGRAAPVRLAGELIGPANPL
ncbi:MAG: SAM-dependent chlorinase/fluorinase [Steroidobacteraceae bacterium]